MYSRCVAWTDILLRRNAEHLALWLHRLFRASLLLKGLLAGAETIAGLGLLLTPNLAILTLVSWLTRNELTQDPTDAMARWFRHAAEVFPIQTQHFYAWYLGTHGALKLVMVLLLARGVRWAYPAAMLVLGGFVTYQVHHWTVTHSPALLLLSAFDLAMIALIWHEWRSTPADHNPPDQKPPGQAPSGATPKTGALTG